MFVLHQSLCSRLVLQFFLMLHLFVLHDFLILLFVGWRKRQQPYLSSAGSSCHQDSCQTRILCLADALNAFLSMMYRKSKLLTWWMLAELASLNNISTSLSLLGVSWGLEGWLSRFLDLYSVPWGSAMLLKEVYSSNKWCPKQPVHLLWTDAWGWTFLSWPSCADPIVNKLGHEWRRGKLPIFMLIILHWSEMVLKQLLLLWTK